MDVRYLKRLIRIVEQSDIHELEIEDGGTRIKIVKGTAIHPAPAVGPVQSAQTPVETQARTAAPAAQVSGGAAEPAGKSNLIEVTSPMVGTFYRAATPGAKSFVEVGDRVSLGQTLCILEAMKLMNEIESEVAGIVREICVENAQPVEFGHRLFLIEREV